MSAISEFNQKDKFDLLKNKVNEMTISHRVAVYLETAFEGYSVDCEYNRSENDKKLNLKNEKVRPDIIVHKRGTNSDNLVVIEVKLAGKKNKKSKADVEKLKNYFSERLNYKLGVFIGVLKNRVDICWILDSKAGKDWQVIENEKN